MEINYLDALSNVINIINVPYTESGTKEILLWLSLYFFLKKVCFSLHIKDHRCNTFPVSRRTVIFLKYIQPWHLHLILKTLFRELLLEWINAHKFGGQYYPKVWQPSKTIAGLGNQILTAENWIIFLGPTLHVCHQFST